MRTTSPSVNNYNIFILYVEQNYPSIAPLVSPRLRFLKPIFTRSDNFSAQHLINNRTTLGEGALLSE